MIRRQVPARLIDDRELDSSAEPDRARLVWTRRQRIGGDLVSCLGQPICFQNGCSKTFLQISQHSGRERRRTRTDKARAVVRSTIRISALKQNLMNRGYGGIPSGAMLAKQPPELRGGKAGRHDYGAPRSQRCQSGADQSVTVKQRHHHEASVRGCQRIM